MDQKEFDQLLERYLRGNATEAERTLVDRWYHTISPSVNPITGSESAQIRKRVLSALQANKARTKRDSEISPSGYRFWQGLVLPIAACSICILIASFFFSTSSFDPALESSGGEVVPENSGWKIKVNTTSSRQLISLDDGSEITLEPDGELEYPLRFDKEKREVRLRSGGAFFNIEKDARRPFYVYSSDVVTKVLGTSFCIKADAQGHVTVDVRTGTVQVSTRRAKLRKSEVEEIVLRPNQRADYNPDRNRIVRALVEKPRIVIPSYEVETMTFEKAPVVSILKAVERAYQVQIRFDSARLSSCALTTHLIPEEDLYTRLKIICEAIDATYRVEDGHILITGSGCQDRFSPRSHLP